MSYQHIPVLLEETVGALGLGKGANVVDGTLGGGGHAEAILEVTSPNGRLIGFDRDPAAIIAAQHRLARFKHRVTYVNDSFSQISAHVKRLGIFTGVDAVLLDLGFSSAQLEDPARGFSFQSQGALDLRYDSSGGVSAAELLQTSSQAELERIFVQYGEEPRARALAKAIVETRRLHPFHTTADLMSVVERVKGRGRRSLHPATLVWQALRIAVNNEFEELSSGLASAWQVLVPNGRLAVISFHSGEDRIVKQWFREKSKACHCPPSSPVCRCGGKPEARIVTRRPIVPSLREAARNPRARSAKLRVIEKM